MVMYVYSVCIIHNIIVHVHNIIIIALKIKGFSCSLDHRCRLAVVYLDTPVQASCTMASLGLLD